MSCVPGFDPKQEFANRLARIEAGGINTNRTLFVGTEDALHLPPGTFVRRRKKRGRALPLFLTLLAGSALAIGTTVTQTNFY
ncbi:MAG: hypothetical protein O9289_10535 [Rhodobacteraceae bacterium]|nr:hypothetical protein [Paracoccaceae bacterium]MCZ8083633.1 hypothetical protein [Paracoccaceae bacterium]